MNRENLIKYIKNPNLIDDEATQEIEQLLQQYPYFQTAHLLFVKGLKNSNSSRFQNQLKIAATHAGNRTLLFNLLHEQHSELVYAPENQIEQTELEDTIPETVPVLPEAVESETPITDMQSAQELEEVQESETQKLDSVVEISTDSVSEEQKGEITEDETVSEDVVIPIESSEIPEPLELDAQSSLPESPPLEDISMLEPPSIVVAEADTSTEQIQESKHIPSETVQTEKTEQSLADIVLQRLKEIEERDKHAQAEQIAESDEPLHEDADVPVEPQVPKSEPEMPDEDTISHTISEQAQEPHVQKPKDDELLDFIFSDFEEKTENETVSPPQTDNKTVVHASSTWFENSEIPPESLDISNPIDAFLAKQPQMKPRFEITESTEEQHDISEESVKEGEYLSETLAKVYVEQKNYTKAIHIYQKLSLKYPQKSVYFANQILEIQQKLK